VDDITHFAIPLRDYLTALLSDLRHTMESQDRNVREIIEQRFNANEIAINKAERAVEARLEGMNQFRDQLREQAMKFADAQAVATTHTALTAAINSVIAKQANLDGRIWMLGAGFGVVQVIVMAILAFLTYMRH